MSARSGALREARPLGLRVGLAAVLAVLLAIGIAGVILYPRTIAETGPGLVLGMPDAHASNRTAQEVAAGDYRIRPHGPNQMPRQFAIRDHRIRAHGPNQMPKR
jgi:hypothetical protein